MNIRPLYSRSGKYAPAQIHKAMKHCASVYIPVSPVQRSKNQVPKELEWGACYELGPVLSSSHSACRHLVRIVHEYKEQTAEQHGKPFPLNQRIEPWLYKTAKTDLFAQSYYDEEIYDI